MASEAQDAADRNDTKSFYSYVHEVFGPSQTTISPVQSKDGSQLHKDITSIRNRWVEHYSELLNRPSSVDMSIIDQVEQLPIINELAFDPTREEVASSVRKLNSGKAPGMDGLTAEVLKAGGNTMIDLLHRLILHYWTPESTPQEWIDITSVCCWESPSTHYFRPTDIACYLKHTFRISVWFSCQPWHYRYDIHS